MGDCTTQKMPVALLLEDWCLVQLELEIVYEESLFAWMDCSYFCPLLSRESHQVQVAGSVRGKQRMHISLIYYVKIMKAYIIDFVISPDILYSSIFSTFSLIRGNFFVEHTAQLMGVA